MFFLFFLILNLINSTLMLLTSHPLTMGLILFIQTLIICLITGLGLKTFWFSYILFLIFLGGLLILFIYVISLASNEMFKFSGNFFFYFFFMILFLLLILLFSDKIIFLTNFFTPDSAFLNLMNNFYNENSLVLTKLFNFPVNIFSIMLMIYLFLTLIVTVKITNIFEGPLRPKFS